MSSTLVGVEKTSKKRKHEGDSRTAKKKQKHTEEDVGTNGVEDSELVANSSKKEKKGKEEKRFENGNAQDSSRVETSALARNEEKKKKRKQAEISQLETPMKEESPIATEQEDEDIPDAPIADQEEPYGSNGTALQEDDIKYMNEDQLHSDTSTSFHAVRTSLYLPIPAIASSGQLSALLALHISPLLLTYFPPLSGVVLAYLDPVLSARPEAGVCRPLLPPINGDALPEDQEEIFVPVGDEFGSSWTWLTATFLVFRPQRGDELTGWTNAMSEGFIGLVSYNYFQTSIAKSRIPQSWTWSGPSRQQTKQRKTPRKGKLNDSDDPSQENYFDSQETVVVREDDAIDGIAGSFLDEGGSNVPDTLSFKVVDLEMISAQERGQRFALQLEGTLLSGEEEREAKEKERLKWENRQGKRVSRSRASTPGTPVMSGGLAAFGTVGSVNSPS